MGTTWSYVNPHTDGFLRMPWEAVLDASNMQYLWVSEQDDTQDGNAVVEVLLTD